MVFHFYISILNSTVKSMRATSPDQSSVISKKRPQTTKLDIEKMLQESIELTNIHNQLCDQNRRLNKDFKKVQEARKERQQFISMVEKIVKEKSSQITSKTGHNSSWLVFKLQKKIYDLKNEIQQKEKTIKKLRLGKENQAIFRKQIEHECLKEIVDFAKSQGLEANPCEDDPDQEQKIKQIIWMQDYFENEEQRLIQLNTEFQQEERQTKRILLKLAEKKSELKRIKQIQRQYTQAQLSYKEEKKKKEENSNKKSFFTNLLKERDNELEKLEQLKEKKKKIEIEQQEQIKRLQSKLAEVKIEYQNNKIDNEEIKHKTMKFVKSEVSEHWVKRVQIKQVQYIANNMNYSLSLKGISQQKWMQIFFQDGKHSYSIQTVMEKLGQYPFEWKNQNQKKLLARYVVEDSGSGFILQDMSKMQDAPIIKSILTNLIGTIKVYNNEEKQILTEKVGDKLCKFWSLIAQIIQTKEGNVKQVTKNMIQEGIQNSQLQFTQEEIDYVVLYLYSWSEDARKLQLQKLSKLLEFGIKWPTNQ